MLLRSSPSSCAVAGARRRQPFKCAATARPAAVKAVSSLKASTPCSSGVVTRLQQQHQQRTVCNVGRRESVYLFGFGGNDDDYYEEDYTVFKLQVGVFGDIGRWQKKIDNIATKYDTDEPEELHHVYTDALMLILRNMEYVGYATSAGKVFRNIEEAETKFNSVLMEERVKFQEETLVNVDGRRRTRQLDVKGDDGGLDRWLCMTLLVCVEGKVKLPNVRSTWDLKKVLTDLGGISADALVAFELLWTPQEENDSYSKNELLADYPSMVTLG